MPGRLTAELTAFAAVAEYLSFSRAAIYLGVSRTSVSKLVRSLEKELQVGLFDRDSGNIRLTGCGEQLLAKLNPGIQQFSRAIDEVSTYRDRPSGTLRLAVDQIAACALLVPLVLRFSRAYPAISLDLAAGIPEKECSEQKYDARVWFGPSIDRDVIAVPIGGKSRLITVASPKYLAHRRGPLSPQDLQNHHCLHYRPERSKTPDSWMFERAGRPVRIGIRGPLFANDLNLVVQACADGVGVAHLPEPLVGEFLAAGSLVQLLADWAPACPGFFLCYPCRERMPANLRTLTSLIEDFFPFK
jgi:DNA-binding transcriptional LysR family regulator